MDPLHGTGGVHHARVLHRALPRHGPGNNTSALQQVAFSVVAGESCLPARSDEFGGTLDTSRWSYRHPTTPTGTRAPSVADGQPAAAARRLLARPGAHRPGGDPGPAAAHGRLHAGDQDHRARAQRRHRRPGQHLRPGRPEALPDQRQLDQGLALAQRRRQPDGRDEHLLRARVRDQRHAHARHPHRPRHGQPADVVAAHGPHRRDARRRPTRSAIPKGRRTGSRSARPTSTRSCRPPSGPRYIGVYGGNGSTTASYDYLRFTPDSAVDRAAPVSSHSAPAPDGAGGWYRTPVDVTLSAADDGECVSGIERTEYRARRRRVHARTRRRCGSPPTASTRSSTARSTRRATPRRRSRPRSSSTPPRRSRPPTPRAPARSRSR